MSIELRIPFPNKEKREEYRENAWRIFDRFRSMVVFGCILISTYSLWHLAFNLK